MKKIFIASLIISLFACGVFAQGKGVDEQTQRIRDTGNNSGNGSRQNVGVGRGIDFGKDRTQQSSPVPNPYRFTVRRDVLVKAVEDLMRDRKLVIDTAVSKPAEGLVISQPYTFIKGAVVSESELSRYADLPAAATRGWTRGRYTLIIEVQPIDGINTNVSVNAKLEGRTDGISGAEWVTLRSTGTAEQEFLTSLVEGVTGASPQSRPQQ